MKTKSLLSLALSLASASSLMAGTVHVYLTGATAFRQNAYVACTKLYSGGTPSVYFGTNSAVGGDANFNSGTAAWCMTGTPISGLTNISGNTLVIHALFSGSIQGIYSVVNRENLSFPDVGGGFISNSIAGGGAAANIPLYACNTFITKSPTLAFSDASASSTPYQVSGNFAEEEVAVAPLVIVRANNNTVSNLIQNVTFEQLYYGIPAGRIPLSTWSYVKTDTNNWVYILERTLDSGTRRCFTAGAYYQYGYQIATYLFDKTNGVWYLPSPSNTNATAFASSPNGVVGSAGLGGANQRWGQGYVGGGDIRSSLALGSVSNQAIACLSFSDARTLGVSNWWNVISYNGIWPTAAGAGVHGNTGTNDFSPITSGYYPLYGKEVIVHVVDPSQLTVNDQAITATQLGDQTTPGSFLGVFNAQVGITPGVASPLAGSIENEIEYSKTQANGATAIRLADMQTKRSTVGGSIAPF
jgi:hypothetical protein